MTGLPTRESFFLALVVGMAGCLGPQVDDTVVGGDLLLPADTEVPTVYENSSVDEDIAEADGVSDLIPLLSGFADGQPMQYWDFGPAPSFAAPLFYIMDPATNMPAHLPIVDVMPGDDGYSPYWSVFTVNITELYNGELMTSIAAIEEAQRLGLVEAPVATGMYANCPIVASEVMLELADGTPSPAADWGFIRGERVAWFDMVRLLGGDMVELEDGVTVPADDLYRLRREGGEPLSEPVRRVDMTGDGDAADSNDILATRVAPWAQRRTVVSVVVAADYLSIDSNADQTLADFTASGDLFTFAAGERQPVPGNVIAYEVVEESRNIIPVLAGGP